MRIDDIKEHGVTIRSLWTKTPDIIQMMFKINFCVFAAIMFCLIYNYINGFFNLNRGMIDFILFAGLILNWVLFCVFVFKKELFE